MGILPGNASLLLEEHRRRPFSGSLLELGRAQVYLSEGEMRSLARRRGVALSEASELALSHNPRLARLGCLDDHAFFRLLGFSDVASVDVSAYEGAEHVANLNFPLSASLYDRFDVVADIGTLQHLFHIPQALANMHAAVRVGGRIVIVMAASHNHVDHGFYMFSPTLFYEFFAANRYTIEAARVIEFTHAWLAGRLFTPRWDVYDYSPGCLDPLSYGGFGRRQLGVFIVATRQADSTGDVIPMQSALQRIWESPDEVLGREPERTGITARLERRLARLAASHPRWLQPVLSLKRVRQWVKRAQRRRPPRDPRHEMLP